MAEWHDPTEEYLENILEMEEEGVTPLRARLVERLEISAPAVSEGVARLEEQGYVQLRDDRSIKLTSKGRTLATSIVRRHRLAERLLADIVGLEWEKIHREADRWEHVISADVEEKLVDLLGDPATCPHGNPIPGASRQIDDSDYIALADAPPGPITVTRISEKLELNDEALKVLSSARLIPGAAAEVVEVGDDGVVVKSRVREQFLEVDVAKEMFVRPG